VASHLWSDKMTIRRIEVKLGKHRFCRCHECGKEKDCLLLKYSLDEKDSEPAKYYCLKCIIQDTHDDKYKLHESVEYKEGGDGPIDMELIPLINELNKAGLKTTQSCGGHIIDTAYVSIDMQNIDDIAIREHGKRLVIWWKFKEEVIK